jgi:flavin reductase (DIM6/NTAB) family NADH-FMN oxidoreductase RutF
LKKSLGADTIVFPAPTWVIGTYDKDGKANVMTAAWGGICSSKPPCVAVSMRKATYSHGNILLKKAFTVNVPSEKFLKEADHFGMVSGRNEDKLKKAGLTAVKSDKVDAPYIKEFPLIVECKLLNVVEIGIHTQFIGEIVDVKAEESVLDENGDPDMLKVMPILFGTANRSYYGVGKFIGKAFNA